MTTDVDGSGYFLYHSIGIYPEKGPDMAQIMSEFAMGFTQADADQWTRMLPLRQEFIDRWSALINAPSGTVTTSENVTSAFATLITSLPQDRLRGKRVLIAADCFPSLHFMLAGLATRLGFTLDTVPIRQGENWVHEEDVIARWGADVGVALLTWVTSTTSHRSDLNGLVAHGRAMGSVIGVDITQAAGLLPFDVTAPMVDFVVSTSLKWLCGTPGAGVLYASSPLQAECSPAVRGWFSQPDPFSWNLDTFSFAPDARRFDNGTPSIVSAIASLPALRWYAAQDHKALYAHTRVLGTELLDGFAGLSLEVVSPHDPDQRGGSLMVRSDQAKVVLDALIAEGITVDRRDDVLRFSPGVMTTQAGVNKVLEVFKSASA